MKRIALAGTTLALLVPGAAIAQDTPTAAQNAAKACKAERAAMGEAAFNEKYGTNKKKTNAFGKCVSANAKAASDAQTKANVRAAKACKAERAADPAAFKAKYGTNKNKSNAFGKCVSAKAKAQNDS